MIFCEVYRRQVQWKFKAVGQGYVGGLEPLAIAMVLMWRQRMNQQNPRN